MNKIVNFALMQYIPNYDRDEKINVAVVLHCPSENYMKIKVTTNLKRLIEFDDELDINFMKSYFKSLEESFTYTSLNLDNIDIKNDNLLESLTCFYVNQFIFRIFKNVSIDISCNEYLDALKNNYLYFDEKKQNRISKNESIKFFAELLSGNGSSYELIGTKNALLGSYSEKINVDFKIENQYFKVINLNDKNIDKYTPTIKMWMLNAIELRDQNQELIFLVNEQILSDKTEIFIKMLEKYAKVIKTNEINDYLK